MRQRILKNNIKKTIYFSSSIILSTLFFVIYLITKNECISIQNDIKSLKKTKYAHIDKVNSLKREKNLLTQNIEEIALERYRFIVPSPEPTTISMDER
tara:strand:+ start:850 stop:1143 length:294 start_codon:yes stop_codon:yes gene_type:complete